MRLVTMMSKKRVVKNTEVKRMQELRAKGFPFSEIAKRVGVPKTTVWGYVKDIERVANEGRK